MRPPLPRSQKLRKVLLIVGSIAFVGALAGLLVSTVDSGSKPKKRVSTTPTPRAATTKALTLELGTVNVQSAGPPAALGLPVSNALLAATQQYFDDAIQAPLRDGGVKATYTKVFDPAVKPLAAGKDRAALTESATGVIRGAAHLLASPVRIDGLGDATGKLALVAASFALQVKADTPAGPLTIRRNTELTFAPELGRWVVTAYRVNVRRSVGTKTTSTTAHAGAPS